MNNSNLASRLLTSGKSANILDVLIDTMFNLFIPVHVTCVIILKLPSTLLGNHVFQYDSPVPH